MRTIQISISSILVFFSILSAEDIRVDKTEEVPAPLQLVVYGTTKTISKQQMNR